MDMGYTFIVVDGQNPFFICPDGMLIYLVVENYIPYLVPGSEYCMLRKQAGSMSFCCASPTTSTNSQPGVPGKASSE